MIRPPKHRHRRNGFSLVELLAVMLIIGILMVALLSGGSSGGGAAERGAAAQVAAALDRARAHAIAVDGYAACVVAGDGAGDAAWRRLAVVELREKPAPAAGEFPYEAADFPAAMVMPWVELPTGIICFGRHHGGPDRAAVDDGAAVKVPLTQNTNPIPCKLIAFNGQGAVLHPTAKALRCLRVGPGDGSGSETILLESDRAAAMPCVTVERFTGRIRVVRP